MPGLSSFIGILEAKQQRFIVINQGLTILRQILLTVKEDPGVIETWPKGCNRQRTIHPYGWVTDCVVAAGNASIGLYPPPGCSSQVIFELRDLLPKNLLKYRIIDRYFLRLWL